MSNQMLTPPRQPATAAQVAELAGVSVFTVSRAFSASPLVSTKTRERIFAAARTIGYSPNVAARALRTGRIDTIALVQPARVLQGEFYSGVLAGVQSSIGLREMDVMLSVVPEGTPTPAWIRKLVSTGRCGAAALFIDVTDDATLAALAVVGVPVVLLNHTPDEGRHPAISSVGYDNPSGVQQALRHLAELGHRDIAYLTCPSLWADTSQREKGFRTGMAELGLPLREEWILVGSEGPVSGSRGFDTLLALAGPKPTAILCANDDLALGVLNSTHRWGKRVPDDISIVGFDDNSWTSWSTPALTTVRHKGWEMGQAAGQILLNLYDNPGEPAEQILLPTQLVVRSSTGRPRGESS